MSAPVIVVTFTDDEGDEFLVSVPAWQGRERRDVLKEARAILAQTIDAGGFLVEGHCRVSGFNGVWENNAWIAASVEDLAPMSYDVDTIAARIAKDAASTFELDEDSEDATSCAQRAADILRDLAPEDRAAFLLRIFGTPREEARELREYDRITLHGNPADDWTRYRELGAIAKTQRGIADVARVLLFEYRDMIEALAFEGHEATETHGESTNLHAYREARAAYDRVQDVRGHTFGACSLDGYADTLDKLGYVAIGAAIEAVSYAAWNATEDMSEGYETGMPRPE